MTISMGWLVTILFAHFIADFMMQKDEHAKAKSYDNIALAKHICLYSIWMVIIVFAVQYTDTFIQSWMFGVWILLNGVLHFGTDYVSSRLAKAEFEKGNTHNFFVVVGLDQFVHYVCLFGTFGLMY